MHVVYEKLAIVDEYLVRHCMEVACREHSDGMLLLYRIRN